ncbi:MAG: nickel pincer cofactor biosynthesis protein LarC [Actinobacteria bacterium]|nr:nickel pincer cofactor biosynthesis protein LarC [Actinomycetota bacterium]MCG2807695.1 nickel pincer cofactor biosynthesis protein LarC [Coriobacteriia bacterium]
MIAYLDCASGVSGDKFLAALLDAGAADQRFTLEHLNEAIASLGLAGIEASSARVLRGGISGLHITMPAEENPPHRHWQQIRTMLIEAKLPEGARDRALRAFESLARAEATVHGADPESVHFHEVGAADSIADIVGVSLGLELLGVEHLVCSTVAVGSGLTPRTAHGTLSVPAPATLELLAGAPIESGSATGELTTPTGAALVRVNADAFGPMPAMVPSRIGYGAGTRETPGMPNVLRLVMGHGLRPETDAPSPTGDSTSENDSHEPVVLLETNLDHIAPEQIAFSAEELLAAGALDVWQSPAAMKKGRLGIELRVLARPADAERLATAIHELTGSLGVRRTELKRTVLKREILEVRGPWGEFRVKVSGEGASRRVRPEHDDIARIARTTGMPYHEVSRRLREAAEDES